MAVSGKVLISGPRNASDDVDTEHSEEHFSADVMFVVQIVMASMGIVGNTFVVFVIVRMTSLYKQLTNVFVINQSVIDATSSLVMLAQTLTSVWVPPGLSARHIPSELYCRLWHKRLLMWCMFTNSTMNLCTLTVERYVMVIHPVAHKNSFSARKARLLIVFTWTFGAAYVLAVHLPADFVAGASCVAMEEGSSSAVNKRVVGLLIITMSYLLPLLLFVVAYSHMINKMRSSGARNNKQRAQSNLTKTLVLVVVGFVVCWSPNEWYYLLHNVGLQHQLPVSGPMFDFTIAMVSVNCCINPFIYIANYKQFRAGIVALFRSELRSRTAVTDAELVDIIQTSSL